MFKFWPRVKSSKNIHVCYACQHTRQLTAVGADHLLRTNEAGYNLADNTLVFAYDGLLYTEAAQEVGLAPGTVDAEILLGAETLVANGGRWYLLRGRVFFGDKFVYLPNYLPEVLYDAK